MKIKKKIWGCLLSLLCIFMLVLPVMASESQETDSEIPAVTSEDLAVPTEISDVLPELQYLLRFLQFRKNVRNRFLWMMPVF